MTTTALVFTAIATALVLIVIVVAGFAFIRWIEIRNR